MKTAKKICLSIALLLLLSSLIACGGKPSPSGTSSTRKPVLEPHVGGSASNLSDEARRWWDGQWYGWYRILEAEGDFAPLIEFGTMDCTAFIDMADDGMGTFYLWDNYDELGTVRVTVKTDEGGAKGVLYSLSGEIFYSKANDMGWASDPSRENYENLLHIYSDYRDDNGYFKYEIYLRPWGLIWDDMPEEERPPFYDKWYIEGNMIVYDSMLNALSNSSTEEGSMVFIPSTLPERAYGPDGRFEGCGVNPNMTYTEL